MSTRPRIQFDEAGRCNACVWSEEKAGLDWAARETELQELLHVAKQKKHSDYDVVVPVSGGKDGSYVAHTLKERYGLKVLAVTVRPALSTELGDTNLKNFIDSGFDHIHVSPNPKVMDQLNKYGFIEMGFPYYGWLIAIKTAVIRVALQFGIGLIFYGEDGEIEYGGSTESKNRCLYDIEYMKGIYFEGGYQKVFDTVAGGDTFSESDLTMWKFPDPELIKEKRLSFTHWSYFEPWDSYRNYVVAKDHCGLQEADTANAGTFTNFAQNDQALYNLHTYLMYLKFLHLYLM